MTAKQLAKLLRAVPPDSEVVIEYDIGADTVQVLENNDVSDMDIEAGIWEVRINVDMPLVTLIATCSAANLDRYLNEDESEIVPVKEKQHENPSVQ